MGKLIRLELFSRLLSLNTYMRELTRRTRLQIVSRPPHAALWRLVLHLYRRAQWIWQVQFVSDA